MQDTLAFILDHADDLSLVLLATYGAAVAIAKLTPTPKDDAFLAKIGAPVTYLASLLRRNSRQKVKSAK